jgi:cytochrome P450
MADPFAATTESARLAAYAELAEAGPAVRITLPNGLPAWLVTGRAQCRTVLNDERFHKTGTPVGVLMRKLRPHLLSALGSHMLLVDGADHSRLRRLVNAAFTRRPMEALDGRISEITTGLLNGLAERGAEPVDLLSEFAYPLPMTVICDMLGMPEHQRASFHAHMTTFSAGVYVDEADFAAAVDGLVEITRHLVTLKRAEPAEDLVSALVAARDGGDQLSEDELTSMIWLLTAAGHETTVNLLASGTAALLTHPEQLARLRAEPALISSAVEELLRFCSPVQVTFPVVATADVELGGVRIPAGEPVVPALLPANRGAAPGSDALDLGRSTNHHLAFGHGAHHCLGAPLARLEARVALSALLARFPDLQLAVAPDQLRWRPNFLFHGLTELPVRLAAYANS